MINNNNNNSHPVKGSCRKHRKIEELEYYQCEITWLSKSHVVDLARDLISSLNTSTSNQRKCQ